MIRRERQLKAGPYRTDLSRGQDYEMILRIARENTGVYAEEITLYQRKHISERKTSRGTVLAQDTVRGWIDAEKTIFREIDDRWTLADFQPWADRMEGSAAERLPVLQRGVIMFMRKVYDRAEIHLRQYAQMLGSSQPTPHERCIASHLLGSRYGVDDLTTDAAPVRCLHSLHLPVQLRTAMASQLPWRLKKLVLGGRMREASSLLAAGHRAFGTPALLRAANQRFRASSDL
jgi:hypothetical protein